jgi:hypothetical protein
VGKRKRKPVKPKCLHHYTTAEGLKGIIENQEIWASDIFSLNDAKEIYHGRDLLLHCVRRQDPPDEQHEER